ncbi:type I secretion system permease/ATPase [Budviciaceae bacterium BWR-B9]|uniref:Type I secretion system permease/ATPase n=2 Tax=Budviciaceae TaxID=1903416 RepID=A0ABS1IPY1_9GAMM|nr:type I secretion system permease/ATPase [Limnobaculum allomyrinae]MBV7692720.1 type I secretion system permease/ATPase [Limnobaculum sp. M2-1]
MSQDFAPATDAQQDSLLWSVQWLAAYYNKPASAAVLYAGLPKEPKLTSQLALRMLDQIGMGVAWVERDLDQLFSYLFPVVLTRKDGSHCIVTERSSGKGAGSSYRVILPENGGEVTLSARALEEMYSGYALLCNPKPKLDERSNDCLPEPNKEGHWLFSTLWRYRHYFASAALAALLANVLTLASTFFTMNVYDRVVPTQAYVTLWSLGIGVFIAIIFEFVSRLVRAHLFDIAGKKADLLLGTMLFRQVLGIRMESKPQSSGAFANQLREFESVRDFVTSATLSTLSDLPFCALFLFIIYLVAGPLVLVPLCAVPIILIVSLCVQWPLAKNMKENLREISLKQGLLIETIDGLESLKAAQGEGVMQKRWEDFSALAAATSMKTKALSSTTTTFVSFMQQLTTVAIVIWGVYLIHAGELTMGSMIGAVILSGRTLSPLGSVVGLTLRFQQAKAALSSLNQLMKMPTERDEKIHYLSAPNFTGNLRLKGVNFSYPSGNMMMAAPVVLQKINISIRRGERVAILGSIGSGKSTLLKVMARLFQPGGGQLMIDNVDATQVDPADWRTSVGYVGQDSRLFFGTLRENVTIGNPSVATEELLQVARMTGLDKVAMRHPLGFEMPIGEMGQGISGGQKQLVSLARCLLLKPKILLMDEPTSSMDAMTELQFINKLKTSITDQTVVLVTHRFSLLELVDRLIVLDEGKVVADGPKDEVIAALKANGKAQ